MKTQNINNSITSFYIGLLKNLSHDNKLDLIEKLSNSMKGELIKSDKYAVLEKLFGSFESDKTAEQIIDEIRDSRTFNRQIEKF